MNKKKIFWRKKLLRLPTRADLMDEAITILPHPQLSIIILTSRIKVMWHDFAFLARQFTFAHSHTLSMLTWHVSDYVVIIYSQSSVPIVIVGRLAGRRVRRRVHSVIWCVAIVIEATRDTTVARVRARFCSRKCVRERCCLLTGGVVDACCSDAMTFVCRFLLLLLGTLPFEFGSVHTGLNSYSHGHRPNWWKVAVVLCCVAMFERQRAPMRVLWFRALRIKGRAIERHRTKSSSWASIAYKRTYTRRSRTICGAAVCCAHTRISRVAVCRKKCNNKTSETFTETVTIPITI